MRQQEVMGLPGRQHRAHVSKAGYVVEYPRRLSMRIDLASSGPFGAVTSMDFVGAGDRDRTGMASCRSGGRPVFPLLAHHAILGPIRATILPTGRQPVCHRPGFSSG
jgi:hypothetical protein